MSHTDLATLVAQLEDDLPRIPEGVRERVVKVLDVVAPRVAVMAVQKQLLAELAQLPEGTLIQRVSESEGSDNFRVLLEHPSFPRTLTSHQVSPEFTIGKDGRPEFVRWNLKI